MPGQPLLHLGMLVGGIIVDNGSSSEVGALIIAQTPGSPRLYASSARTSTSPSIHSLRTPAPTGCRNLARIHDVAFDPFILQRAIDPESVEASLLNDDEREDPADDVQNLSHN